MRPVIGRGLSVALLASYSLANSGCTDWFRTPGGPVPARLPKKAQVWVADSSFLVRDAILRNDSLIGTIRFVKGDTTGVLRGWRLEDMDSVRVRHVSATRSVLAVFGIAGAILAILAFTWDSSNSEL